MTKSDVVIRVAGLGKSDSLHHEQSERYTALRDVVAHQAKAAGRLHKSIPPGRRNSER